MNKKHEHLNRFYICYMQITHIIFDFGFNWFVVIHSFFFAHTLV